jgi:deazaflavin-dependent oxidoreductase (nitroreductase family)
MSITVHTKPPIAEGENMTSLNDDVVAEFRANSGTVTQAMDGNLADLELALLHHTGRRSGTAYVVPVAYMSHEDEYLMVGSFAGATTEPQWVANIENTTEVTVEIGTGTRAMTPTVLRSGPDRDSLYQDARDHWPFLLEYEKQTSRPFPVIRLAPIG